MISFSVDEINSKIPNGSTLVAISYVRTKSNRGRVFIFKCTACGSEKEFVCGNVLNGHTMSCGCKRSELISNGVRKYAGNVAEIRGCYTAMIRRCYTTTADNYHNYGGRGVVVCKEWKEDYQKFLDWALSNGWKKGLQLDKDFKGDGMLYSPETCCFMTPAENMKHRRNSFRYEYNGQWLTLREILDIEKFDGAKAIGNLDAKVVKNGKEVRYVCTLFIREKSAITQ